MTPEFMARNFDQYEIQDEPMMNSYNRHNKGYSNIQVYNPDF